MEPKLQTSFIPRKMSADARVRTTPIGFFSIAGWVIFLAAILVAAGLFAYGLFLTHDITAKTAELQEKTQNFDVEGVESLVRLNNRIETAKSLIDNHLSLSKLFDVLSDHTIQSVQFTGFNYSADANKLTVVLTGRAPDFSSVALQSDTFSKLPYLKDQIFSDLSFGGDNKSVLFKFTAAVDPSAIRYTVASVATTTRTTSSAVASSTSAQ